jgi:hypothetical protein
VKDYRDHSIATLFGQVTIRLPRFLCALCGRIETGINWLSHCRSTPELDRLRAHVSALMSYPVVAELLEHMFPVATGTDPETLRPHTLKVGKTLVDRAAARPGTAASAITVTLDSTFIRSCEIGERHLEVRVGNVETKSGRRRECRHGHYRADREETRCSWPNRGYRVDGLHRWLSRTPAHSHRRRCHGTTDT